MQIPISDSQQTEWNRHISSIQRETNSEELLTVTLVALTADAAQYAMTDCTVSCHHVLLLLENMRLLCHILKLTINFHILHGSNHGTTDLLFN